MRSSIYVLFFVLQLFIVSIKCGPLPSNEEANYELLKDEIYDASKYAKQVAEGVKLIGSGGYVDLVISGDSLYVHVDSKSCVGKVLFCYAAKPGYMTPNAKNLCSGLSNFCGFQVIGTNNDITLMTANPFSKSYLKECSFDIKMQHPLAEYCTAVNNINVTAESCTAAISTGVPFTIHVEDAGCSVIIKNATIYVPPTTLIPSTIPPPTLLPGPLNNDTTKNEKTSEASTETWAWIVLSVVAVLIVVGIIAGILLCWKKEWCMFEKKKKSVKAPPPPAVTPIVSTTVEKVAASAKSKSKKQKPKPPKLVVEVPTKKPSPTLSLAPTPPTTKSVKKPKEKKGVSPAKKPKTPPPPPVAAKKKSNGKKVGRVSPGKKTKESSTQSYTPPFCLVPIRPPSPPKEPLVPGYIVHTNRKPGQKGQYANSLELPSYSGGKLVPPKITAAEIEKAKMEEWEQERQLLKELKERNNS